jgi:hypothetical protein
MPDIDIKSMAIGGVFTLAVGSGAYALYLKQTTPALVDQLGAREALGKCVMLLDSYNSVEIDKFIVATETLANTTDKSEAMIKTMQISSGQNAQSSGGMSTAFKACRGKLLEKRRALKN